MQESLVPRNFSSLSRSPPALARYQPRFSAKLFRNARASTYYARETLTQLWRNFILHALERHPTTIVRPRCTHRASSFINKSLRQTMANSIFVSLLIFIFILFTCEISKTCITVVLTNFFHLFVNNISELRQNQYSQRLIRVWFFSDFYFIEKRWKFFLNLTFVRTAPQVPRQERAQADEEGGELSQLQELKFT